MKHYKLIKILFTIIILICSGCSSNNEQKTIKYDIPESNINKNDYNFEINNTIEETITEELESYNFSTILWEGNINKKGIYDYYIVMENIINVDKSYMGNTYKRKFSTISGQFTYSYKDTKYIYYLNDVHSYYFYTDKTGIIFDLSENSKEEYTYSIYYPKDRNIHDVSFTFTSIKEYWE